MNRSATALWLLLGYALFVVYGSLVPLDFTPLPLAEAWARFQGTPFLALGLDSRADWVANGVLYAPLGFLAARVAFERGLPQAVALPLAALGCSALAVAVEFTQLFFPPRTVSQNDMLAECIGSVVGAGLLPFLTGWLQRLALAWRGGGARLFHHLLQAYAVGYVLFCFFPFDLLLSMDELRGKLASDNWGWLIARPEGFSWLRSGLHWAVELALTMPFGFLLARRAPAGRAGLLRAALVGALLGVAIELAQLLVETAISQGVSVASRALGTAFGLLAARAWQHGGIEPWRRVLLRHSLPLGAAYALLLTLANGWWSHPWHGFAGAAAAWQELRLLPFYYQYYTSEAIALYSSGSVVVMYLPLAALGWALRLRPRQAAAGAAATAFVMEAGKLFLGGTHPDPTDVLLAAAACWLALGLLQWLDEQPEAADAPLPAAPATLPAHAAPRSAWRHALPLVALGALGLALAMPAWPLLIAAVLLATGVAAWYIPPLLLAIVPAALPVFDLAPWTGRFFVDEFDLLLAAGLAIGFYRTPPVQNTAQRAPWRPWMLAFAAFGLSLALSALRAFWPNEAVDLNSFSSFLSSFNGLRIAKGALWAWLFLRLFLRVHQRIVTTRPERATPAATWFSVGVQLGLAATVAVVFWERSVFAGWLDFTSPFRVSGPFSAMLRGGAYVECFLAVGSAFTVASALSARSRGWRAAAWLLLAATAYALVVTYSRNGYAAFAAVLAIGMAASVMPSTEHRPSVSRRPAAPARVWLPVLVVGLGAAALVLGGGFARERLAQSRQDLATRAAHWADALTLGSASAVTQVFGVGVGRFPQAHFWRSREPVHAAGFDLAVDSKRSEKPKPFLRLGTGAPVYVEQIVTLDPGANYRISARLRSAAAAPRLTVMLCRKWGLSSGQCESATLAGAGANGAADGRWQAATATLHAARLLPMPWYARAPLKLSLLTPGGGGAAAVDVDDLRLEPLYGRDEVDASVDGTRNAIVNGDFSAGLDRWFFSTDTDPPWHIHNLALALLFDQGWFGLLSGAAVALVALAGGWRAMRRGGPAAMAPLAAFVAFLVSGSLNTLIDAPRFLWLFLVLAWLCAWSGWAGPAASASAAVAVTSGRRAVDEHAQLTGGERGP